MILLIVEFLWGLNKKLHIEHSIESLTVSVIYIVISITIAIAVTLLSEDLISEHQTKAWIIQSYLICIRLASLLIKAWVNISNIRVTTVFVRKPQLIIEELNKHARASWYIHMDLFQMDGFLGGTGKNNLPLWFLQQQPPPLKASRTAPTASCMAAAPGSDSGGGQSEGCCLTRHLPFSPLLHPPAHSPPGTCQQWAACLHWDPQKAPLISPAKADNCDLWSLPSSISHVVMETPPAETSCRALLILKK